MGRQKILNDARKIGVDWDGDVAELSAAIPDTLEPLRAGLVDEALENSLPEYYCAPFHAYEDGNLGWMPALEAEVSSRTVHAQYPAVEPLEGDNYLRGNALDIMASRWDDVVGGMPNAALDVGCSVGLSTVRMKERWPEARVVGVDPSAEMLAVGALRRPAVEYFHGLGEELPDDFERSFDVVSLQLVVHELPDKPMRAILMEAMRVLRPGGMLCVMDVDPSAFDAVPAVIMALFRSTEPYFEDHKSRNVGDEMEKTGFCSVAFDRNTPRHRTYTAFKPQCS